MSFKCRQKRTMDYRSLNKLLGNIDIYLLDQILKGRFEKSSKILDAGCGEGRNLVYFLRDGYEVFGIDREPGAIRMLQFMSRSIRPGYDLDNFAVGTLEALPYSDQSFDVLICSAVLHFAEDEAHFLSMTDELFRVLKLQGIMFIRMTSDIGLNGEVKKLDDWKYLLPDGSVRFLLTRTLLEKMRHKYQFEFVEPLKTVNVADQRCMSTLVLKKSR